MVLIPLESRGKTLFIHVYKLKWPKISLSWVLAQPVLFDQLSCPEQLNELMDTHAKVRVNHIFTEQIPPSPNTIKFKGWSLWIDEVKCTSDPTKQMMQRIHYNTMRTCLT
jgi:hypothetical protein